LATYKYLDVKIVKLEIGVSVLWFGPVNSHYCPAGVQMPVWGKGIVASLWQALLETSLSYCHPFAV